MKVSAGAPLAWNRLRGTSIAGQSSDGQPSGRITAAAVSADEPCKTMVLAPAARRWLEEHDERLALKLYRYLLAGRFQGEPRASLPDEAVKPGSGSKSESPP